MDLTDLRRRIDTAPTIMPLEQELAFMGELMTVPRQEIHTGWDDFAVVIDHLAESHTDAIFEVTARTLPRLTLFSRWVVDIAEEVVDPHQRAVVISWAEVFRVDPAEHFPTRPGRS